jgi:hypothetical protein
MTAPERLFPGVPWEEAHTFDGLYCEFRGSAWGYTKKRGVHSMPHSSHDTVVDVIQSLRTEVEQAGYLMVTRGELRELVSASCAFAQAALEDGALERITADVRERLLTEGAARGSEEQAGE